MHDIRSMRWRSNLYHSCPTSHSRHDMYPMKIKHLLPFFLIVAACSSDSNDSNSALNNVTNNSTNSASNNATNHSTNNSNNSTNNVATDMGDDLGTVSDAGSDTGSDMSLADAEQDLGVDAAADVGDPFASRPVGQCAVTSDCPENPNGKDCNRLLPGGSCGACDAFNDLFCDDTCFNGTCVTTCGTTEECPAGLRCTGSGRCAAQPCVNDVCPVPMFGCSASGLCQRIDCSADANICPSNTTCLLGLCIEDRQLP